MAFYVSDSVVLTNLSLEKYGRRKMQESRKYVIFYNTRNAFDKRVLFPIFTLLLLKILYPSHCQCHLWEIYVNSNILGACDKFKYIPKNDYTISDINLISSAIISSLNNNKNTFSLSISDSDCKWLCEAFTCVPSLELYHHVNTVRPLSNFFFLKIYSY